jgi:hypothetical protein
MQPVKELLEAIQSEAEFENIEVEKAIINSLELLNRDLVYVQYESSSDVEEAIIAMNKTIAKAESDIEEEEDDEDEEEDLLDLEDEDEDEEEDILDLTPEDPEEDTEESNDKPIPSP